MSLAEVACLPSICVVTIREDVLGKDICLPHPKRSHSGAFFRRVTFPLILVCLAQAAQCSLGGLFFEKVDVNLSKEGVLAEDLSLAFLAQPLPRHPPPFLLLPVGPCGIHLSGCSYCLCQNAKVLLSAAFRGPLPVPGAGQGSLEGDF